MSGISEFEFSLVAFSASFVGRIMKEQARHGTAFDAPRSPHLSEERF